MSLQEKVQRVLEACKTAAKNEGLIFVDGPNTSPAELDTEVRETGMTNGQHRKVVSLGFALE